MEFTNGKARGIWKRAYRNRLCGRNVYIWMDRNRTYSSMELSPQLSSVSRDIVLVLSPWIRKRFYNQTENNRGFLDLLDHDL